MKKYLLLFVMILLPMIVSADVVEIDGIYYNLITKGGSNFAEVTSGDTKYSGDIIIPMEVKYDGIQYNVISIKEGTFNDCSELSSIVIPNSIKVISNCFNSCDGLKIVSIPSSVESIDSWCFNGCTNIELVKITDLSAWCKIKFGNTQSNPVLYAHKLELNGEIISSLEIPNDITIVLDNTFNSCTTIHEISSFNNVTKIGMLSFAGTGLKCLELPSSIKNLSMGAFNYCVELEELTIPESIKEIPQYAFSQCEKLKIVRLPSTLLGIGKNAFADCTDLSDVYCLVTDISNCNTDKDAFINSFIEATTLHVPSESINKYKEVEPWKNFKEIVVIDGDFIDATQVSGKDVLIQSIGGVLTIQGVDDGTKVSVYNASGVLTGSATGKNGQAMINTNLQTGSVAIVKIGEKTVKVMVK